MAPSQRKSYIYFSGIFVSEEKKILSLRQLNETIEDVILNRFGSVRYWVVAEISRINEKNGHRYLELVDSDHGQTTALMSANLWATTFRDIYQSVGNDISTILKAGNKVLFQLRVEFHKVYGLKVNILDIDPTYSFGEIERKKQETIQQLKNEGLFDLQKKLYLPVLSKKIALIGSPGTSGYRDFLEELEKNSVYRNFTIMEFSSSVQGDKAAPELVSALKKAQQFSVDAILIVRGGGSKMDLNVFNDYGIARTICETKIPVITGIGHESDETVADLVANVKCITPTAAAKFLYLRIGQFASQLNESFDALLKRSQSMLGSYRDEFYYLHQYLIHFSRQQVLESDLALRDASRKLQLGFMELISSEKADLRLLLNRSSNHAQNAIHLEKEVGLPAMLEKINIMVQHNLHQSQLQLENIADILDMLDPLRLLKSGYTISTIDDLDVQLYKNNLTGKEMKTLTTNAILTSIITKSETKKYED